MSGSALDTFVRRHTPGGIAHVTPHMLSELQFGIDPNHFERRGENLYLSGIRIIVVEPSTESYRAPIGRQG